MNSAWSALSLPPCRQTPEHLDIACTLSGLPDGAVAELFGRLYIKVGQSDTYPATVEGGSRLGFNPLKALASTLPDDRIPPCLDGQSQHNRCPGRPPSGLSETLYAIIAAVVDRFVELLCRAGAADIDPDRENEGTSLGARDRSAPRHRGPRPYRLDGRFTGT